jgi:hypothetical protein
MGKSVIRVSAQLLGEALFPDTRVTVTGIVRDDIAERGELQIAIEGPEVPDAHLATCIVHKRPPLTFEFRDASKTGQPKKPSDAGA